MALQDHATFTAIIAGNPLEDLTSIEITTNSGQQRVDVLKTGLAGFTPGSGDVTVTLAYTIPIGGSEYDYQGNCAKGSYVPLQIGRANKDYVGTGKILDNTESISVNGSAEGRITWQGELKPYE